MKWIVNLEQEYRWEKLVEKSLRKTLDNGGGSWYNIGENWIKDVQDNWILNVKYFWQILELPRGDTALAKI